ncbi:hypothetical protein ACFL3S_01915, partial [Gemmatimonadota bacterium]
GKENQGSHHEDESEGQTLGYLADGLTESLIDRLALIRGLDVISSNGVARFSSTEIPRDSISRALQAGTLVEGSVEEVGDRLRVSVRLIDGPSGVEYDRRALEAPRGDLLTLRDSLAFEVAVFLREGLGEEIRLSALRSSATVSEAWSLVLRGREIEEGLRALVSSEGEEGAAVAYAQADSLFAAAEPLDPNWSEPAARRAWIAYLHSQWRGTSDRPFIEEWATVGLEHANRALLIDPLDPEALEARGSLRYWRWLMRLEVDPAAADQLLVDAEEDLRAAVAGDRGRASAWGMLSHLLTQKPGGRVESRLAAQRAYEADAFLRNISTIIQRLWTSSYDLEDQVEAAHWCRVGAERFPENPVFKQCQLWLMTMDGQAPDPDQAWHFLNEYTELSPPQYRPYRQLAGQMAVAIVLARAGMADSCRAVVQRSLGDATVDPTRDTQMYGAIAMVQLGDFEEAVGLLTEYVSANPRLGTALVNDGHWWWEEIRGRSDFQALGNVEAPGG